MRQIIIADQLLAGVSIVAWFARFQPWPLLPALSQTHAQAKGTRNKNPRLFSQGCNEAESETGVTGVSLALQAPAAQQIGNIIERGLFRLWSTSEYRTKCCDGVEPLSSSSLGEPTCAGTYARTHSADAGLMSEK